MFICIDCYKKHDKTSDTFSWDIALKSGGNCEVCGKTTTCADMKLPGKPAKEETAIMMPKGVTKHPDGTPMLFITKEEKVDFGRWFTANGYTDENTTHKQRDDLFREWKKGELLDSIDPWISCADRLPDVGDEYNVAWDLDVKFGSEDGLVTTTMEFDFINKIWRDVIGGNADVTERVKYWQPLPTAPKK